MQRITQSIAAGVANAAAIAVALLGLTIVVSCTLGVLLTATGAVSVAVVKLPTSLELKK